MLTIRKLQPEDGLDAVLTLVKISLRNTKIFTMSFLIPTTSAMTTFPDGFWKL